MADMVRALEMDGVSLAPLHLIKKKLMAAILNLQLDVKSIRGLVQIPPR